MRDKTSGVAVVVVQNGLLYDLAHVHLVALQNGVQEYCFFLPHCAQVFGRHQD